MKEILKLKPAFKDYIWGGQRLKEFYKVENLSKVSEAWVTSTHPDGESTVGSETFTSALKKTNESVADNFPILTKLIDAEDNLSIQVHPDEEFAQKNENQHGKTEMWYVIDCKEGAGIYYGFNRDITKDELRERIKNETLLEVLNFVPAKKGDSFFIPAGTLHAICKGMLIAEVQQNSNVTYRVYDYGRVGADGKPRELHIDKAVEVSKLNKQEMKNEFPTEIKGNATVKTLTECDLFTVKEVNAKEEYEFENKGYSSVLVIEGEGKADNVSFKKFDSLYIPEDYGKVKMKGNFKVLIAF